jgi:hypothetical protein
LNIPRNVNIDDEDYRYLEDVILKIKKEAENEHQLSDYIDAVYHEYKVELNEDTEALIIEAKELHKTLRKMIDISCKNTL